LERHVVSLPTCRDLSATFPAKLILIPNSNLPETGRQHAGATATDAAMPRSPPTNDADD
jgi:hypothetical protein